MMNAIRAKISGVSTDFWFFLSAVLLAGFGGSIVDSVFNNFLNDTYALSAVNRTFLELPRECPGFLVVFISAILFFFSSRKLAAVSMLIGATGLFLIAFFSAKFNMMLLWLFIFSIGQHLFMPLNTTIAMDLAKEGQTGKRLGQFNAARNVAGIAGSLVVFLGFRFLHFDYRISFVLAGLALVVAFFLLSKLKADKPRTFGAQLKLYKEYRLFYWLNILFGTRKQIFLTFAPWVLVTVFKQPTSTVATLLLIGGILGIVFQPILGKAVDTLGERVILCTEAVVLVFVCIGYGFSKTLFAGNVAFVIAAACYVADLLLMSFGMARSTYLKKIAVKPEHIAPTLAMATTIDHVFSISTALAAGAIWNTFGYKYVFLLGAGIAVINFFSAMLIKVPGTATSLNVRGNV